MSFERLELRVDVGLAVHRVDEPVQALARRAEGTLGCHGQDVVVRQVRQHDPEAVEDLRRVKTATVQLHRHQPVGRQVHEGLAPGSAAKRTVVVDANRSTPVVTSSATS